ncbi:MAG: glycosyltransferase family 4 protein [Proteobacteria bacterium]|nr:glycosyltransferase family 4 protein [Pseudomonadota bacterium]
MAAMIMGIFIRRGKNSRFKVMFLIAEDWYFLSHRQPLAQACRDLGWEVVIATRVHRHGETIRGMGFSLVPIQMDRRNRNVFKELRTIFELVRILAKERPNILHQVGLKPVIYGSIAAMICPPDVVVNALAGMGYVFTASHLRVRMVRAVMRRMLQLCLRPKNHRLLVQNDEDAAAFMVGCKIAPDHITVIRGSGVNVDRYVPVPEPEGEVVVAVVSRMLKDKGIREVVLAARELKRRGTKVRVLLVGRPDPANPSSIGEDTLRQWHREGCIEWLGHQNDIAAVWSKAHIAVLPSYREGLPKSLLEAAACGRPIVTTDVPGCRDVVVDGVNGFLVPTKSWIELADAIEVLAGSRELRRRMGAAGRARVEARFSQDIVIRQTLDLYRSASERAGRPCPLFTAEPPPS